MVIRWLSLLALLALVACGSTPQDERLEEAANVHQDAVVLGAKVSEMLEAVEGQLGQLSNDQKARYHLLKQEFEEWRDLVVEVPGYTDEAHDHAHDHHHGPNKLEGLPPEQILEIQQELKKQIALLHAQVQALSKIQPGSNDGV